MSVARTSTGTVIPEDDPRAVALVLPIHAGDLETIRQLVADDLGPASARWPLGDAYRVAHGR